jgi:hypothetical protein
VVLWIAAGIFVLLCANEMFGTPPLMTPALRPSTMAGSWQSEGGGTEVIFAIHPDGSVAGKIGEAAFEDGRLTGNRSWFGRLMNWRTNYWIRGTLSGSGEKFSAPLNFNGEVLEGTVFVSDKPAVGRLRMRKL